MAMEQIAEVALATTNVAACASLVVQWKGLMGSRGVTPVAAVVEKLRERYLGSDPGVPSALGRSTWMRFAMKCECYSRMLLAHPSIFLVIGASDMILRVSLWVSLCTSLLVGCAAGLSLLSAWTPLLAAWTPLLQTLFPLPGWTVALGCMVAAVVHSSFTELGNPWTGLQFESLLIESNALFAWGRLFSFATPSLWVWLWRWLMFRLMFAAGAGKLSSGDIAWRDGTAMAYHYETQPLPNFMSKFMHQLPAAWHRMETYATFVVEGPLALTFFASWAVVRWVGFLGTVGFNLMVGLTGNYGHLHMLCITCSLAIIAEFQPVAWAPFLALATPSAHESFTSMIITWMFAPLAWAGGLAYVGASLVPFCANFGGIVDVKVDIPGWDALVDFSARLQQLHLVGTYNLFATMTRFRWELQLEGTCDGGRTWHPFRYHNKPGGPRESLDEVPKTLLPGYFLRSDWRMWFVPLQIERMMELGIPPNRPELRPGWYAALVSKLLRGEPDVVDLVITPPALQGHRLDGVRTLVYDYHFTGRHEQATPPAGAQADVGEHASVRSPPAGDAPGRGAAPIGRGRAGPLQNALPAQEWEIGRVWKRKFVCLYDVQAHPEFIAASTAAKSAKD